MRPPDLSRTPSLPRFALGKILLLVEDGAFAGVNQAIRKHTQGRYGAWRATGASMTPTYNPELTITGRFYGIRRERFAPSEVKRGMMVSSRSPMDDDRWLGKRIIGIPGDIVRTRSDCVHNRYVKVPPGYRWIEGDGGKARSIDSNQFGPVPIEDVRAILHFMIYPFAYWGKLQWQLKGQEILKDMIVTDPAQIKALEKKGGLEFVMSWKAEQSIIKTHAKKVEVTAEGDQKAVALRGQAIGFLQKVSVRCLQEKGVKAAKARAKVATTNSSSSSNSNKNKQPGVPVVASPAIKNATTVLDQWRAYGGTSRTLKNDVVVFILPGTISEADREVLRKSAKTAKEETGYSYGFVYPTEITAKTNETPTKTSGTNKKKKRGLFTLDFGDVILINIVASVAVVLWLPTPTP